MPGECSKKSIQSTLVVFWATRHPTKHYEKQSPYLFRAPTHLPYSEDCRVQEADSNPDPVTGHVSHAHKPVSSFHPLTGGGVGMGTCFYQANRSSRASLQVLLFEPLGEWVSSLLLNINWRGCMNWTCSHHLATRWDLRLKPMQQKAEPKTEPKMSPEIII